MSIAFVGYAGSGTSGVVALRQGKSFIGIDLNPKYVEMAKRRLNFNEDNPFVKFEYLKV
jgi:DNA modification methylase